jgi:AraC-like DNA-binding protein
MANRVDTMADRVIPASFIVRQRPPVTVPIVLVHTLMAGVRARGQPCTEFLTRAGIAADLLSQPGARVTADQYAELFRALVEGLGDEFLLLGSRPMRPGCFALVARMAASARTLEQGMRRAAHTFGLLQDDMVLEPLSERALAGWALRLTHPSSPHPQPLQELVVRVMWRLLAWLAGGKLPPRRFDFAFAQPLHASAYDKVFPAPTQFEQPLTAFWFDAARLQDIVQLDDAAIASFLANSFAHVVLTRRRGGDDSARVLRHLHLMHPLWHGLAATAAALHLSTSSLQKRLAREGTSFQVLKDELRRDMAVVRLSTGAVSLETLSRELGFSDSPSFQRAFKIWTGSAPGSYRRRMTGERT